MTIFDNLSRDIQKWAKEQKKRFEGAKPQDSSFSKFLSPQLIQETLAVSETLSSDEVLSEVPISKASRELTRKVPYQFARKNMMLPFKEEQGVVHIAVVDAFLIEPIEELKFLLDQPVEVKLATREALSLAIHQAYETREGAASDLIRDLDKSEEGKSSEVEVFDLLDDSANLAPIIKLLNLMLSEAIQQNASDIHFEPSEEGLKIRYRIDGVLHTRHSPALEYQAQLITRIKVMAKMDIAEHRLPQDGRIKLKVGRREVDFRVSTVPTSGGERIVLRILDKENVVLGLETLGMLEHTSKEFERLTHFPEGIVLVTGPTGSGKTTTLYSAISDLKDDATNIMTIEDPVEYHLKGIAQIGVHHKIQMDFATGLRHILRQDPDIIMVGEIRDVETAEIAIQASLTGHLVLSTLHTNDAPSAITRLVDMGIEPYLLSSSVIGVLAQRLLRKICPKCKTSYKPTDEELKSLNLKNEDLPHGHLWIGRGCPECFGSGFKGRHGVYELMTVTAAIQKQIVTSADAIAIRNLALQEGMVTLRDHGKELVKKGVTTIKEVLRVTRGVDEN